MPSPHATAMRVPARRALRAGLRLAEIGLAVAGASCLVAYALACARASYTQSTESAAFDAAVRARIAGLEREAPNRSEWSPARIARYEASLARPVEALGRLEIPEAGVSVMVLEGTDEDTLDRAVGRIEGTARPDEAGNLGIAGHRDGYFRGLRHLGEGDEITLTTLAGRARYEVDRIQVVSPDRVDVLASTSEPTLTLVTCFPFYHVGNAPERFVVRARRTSYESWGGAAERGATPLPSVRN